MLWGLPHGVKAAPMLAPIPIKVAGRISGSLYFLAMFKYRGIMVKQVMSLPRNMPEKTDQESKEEDQLPGGVSDRRQFIGNDVQNVQVAVDLDQDQHGRDRLDRVPVHVGVERPGKEKDCDGDHDG